MIEVLKNSKQISDARKALNQIGADSSTGLARLIYTLRFSLRFRRKVEPVAINKSWDVYRILKTIEKFKPKKETPIYDMGSYNCEIPLALWSQGYRNLYAADFNPLGRSINWYGNNIKFRQENFYESTIEKHSLEVITALSVIEHGFEQVNFFKVCNDLLKSGGLVLITTDFHQKKIAIDPKFTIFNLSYMIFSKEEILSLIDEAKLNGFELIDNNFPDNWSESENPINFLDHDMSFIFLGFRKK
ncbi:MAG: class I SAM-dependent methyltransferase [Bacteriovoracaceae bacterium]